MNILGVGTDLVEVERVAKALERQGDRFLRRVYTQNEITYCGGRPERLAARFAAKEAVAKAFGTGIGEAMAFREIEVIHHPSGQPAIVLHGTAAATANVRKVTSLHLSLSHTATHAIASVVITA